MYNYVVTGWPESIVAQMSLMEYIRSDHHTNVSNAQVRQIAGVDPAVSNNALARAKHNVANNITTGLTERFDESMVFFRRHLGWSRLPLYIRLNTSTKHVTVADVGNNVLAEIRQRDALDVELYHFAKDLFMEKIDSQPEFSQEVTRYRRWNKWVGMAGNVVASAYQRMIVS